MTTVSGKSVILTGGGGEIGREVARQFLDGGAQVLLVDLNESALEEAVQALGGDNVDYCVADVTSEEDTKAYVGKALEVFGRIDVLLANAVVIVLGLAASLLPAWRAARYEPIEALTKS